MWHNITEEHILNVHCCQSQTSHRFLIFDPGSAQQLCDPTADEWTKSEN